MLALVLGPELGWASLPVVASLLAGTLLGGAFILVERRSADPLVPHAMLRNPWLILGTLVAALFMATFGSLLFFLSLFFQGVLRFNPVQTGLAFLLPTIVVALSSTFAGRLATGYGLLPVMTLALVTGAGGALLLGRNLSPDMTIGDIIPGLIATSIADGALFTTMFVAGATGVAGHQQGVASGIVSTGSGVGAAIGLAILVMVANSGIEGLEGEALRVATAEGISRAMYVITIGIGATLAVIGIFSFRNFKNSRDRD